MKRLKAKYRFSSITSNGNEVNGSIGIPEDGDPICTTFLNIQIPVNKKLKKGDIVDITVTIDILPNEDKMGLIAPIAPNERWEDIVNRIIEKYS